MINVRPRTRADDAFVRGLLLARWGATTVVSLGVPYDVAALPACLAEDDGRAVGLATYRIDDYDCEILTLDSIESGLGVGRALLAAAADIARSAGCRRLWLVTTNDNLAALRFLQRAGLDLVAVHREAVTAARRIKPSIPLVGYHDIAMRHELELELLLGPPG